MPILPVDGLSPNDGGRLLVRVNVKYRVGIPRYGIARLTNSSNSKSLNVLVLGHDDAKAIFMPYDIRTELGVERGGQLDFTIKKVGWIGKVCWYLRTPDPAVHVPAWLALVSVILGALGLAVSVFGYLFPPS
jgi:hypothetical protein